MRTLTELFESMTLREFSMLETIVSFYDENNNICYDSELTNQKKGIVGSLVKKGLVYDSFENMNDTQGHNKGNWFPSYEVLMAFQTETVKEN